MQGAMRVLLLWRHPNPTTTVPALSAGGGYHARRQPVRSVPAGPESHQVSWPRAAAWYCWTVGCASSSGCCGLSIGWCSAITPHPAHPTPNGQLLFASCFLHPCLTIAVPSLSALPEEMAPWARSWPCLAAMWCHPPQWSLSRCVAWMDGAWRLEEACYLLVWDRRYAPHSPHAQHATYTSDNRLSHCTAC